MNINSYAYAEVLDVLDNMETKYVEKIPQSFIEYLKENSDSDYQKHVTLDEPLEKQNLNSKTLSILAAINLKYWVESENHKQELLKTYRKNGEKQKEKLSEKVEVKDIFEKAEEIEKEENRENLSQNLPIARKSLFRRIIDYFESKIFE